MLLNVETSLGYYINPMVNVLIGYLVLVSHDFTFPVAPLLIDK